MKEKRNTDNLDNHELKEGWFCEEGNISDFPKFFNKMIKINEEFENYEEVTTKK